MAARHIVNVDLAKVFGTADRKESAAHSDLGRAVEVVKITATHVEIKTTRVRNPGRRQHQAGGHQRVHRAARRAPNPTRSSPSCRRARS